MFQMTGGPRSPMHLTRHSNFATTHGFTVSRVTARNGPITVRNVTEQMSIQYGIQDGDILQSVNDENLPQDCTALEAITILSNSSQTPRLTFQSRNDYDMTLRNPRLLRNVTHDVQRYPIERALAQNGFYAARKREHSTTVQVLHISAQLSTEIGIGIGDILFTINGAIATTLGNMELYQQQLEGLRSFRLVSKLAYQRMTTMYETLLMKWDFQNPCVHCGYVYLSRENNAALVANT